jgi:hypothetical protein
MCRLAQELRTSGRKIAVARDPGSVSRDRAGSVDAFVTNYASPIVLEVSILVLIESAAVWRFCWALEHFHFYSAQDRTAKCGFS